jgi:hypothetical protein
MLEALSRPPRPKSPGAESRSGAVERAIVAGCVPGALARLVESCAALEPPPHAANAMLEPAQQSAQQRELISRLIGIATR